MLALSLLLPSALAAIADDLMKTLPGAPVPLNFNLYSGYLKLTNDTDSKQIHYVFAENPTNPKNAPVVLWLNGGPGCSSMDGFMYENGPFYFSFNSTTLNVNPYAWNSVANMLYFESPAGVGFSIAGNSGNLATNDWTTAVDNLTALQLFFKGFPEYLGNEFFISGESYAGIYVPTLAY